MTALHHDLDARRQSLVGTCIITAVKDSENPPRNRRYIASLITSLDYGKNADEPVLILENTRKAFQSLKNQISQINADNATQGIDLIDEVWAVRLNSGLFKVPWEKTKAILEEETVEEEEKRENNIRTVYHPENVAAKLQNNIRIVYPPENVRGKLRMKATKRKFDDMEGSAATSNSDDPSPDDPSPVDPSSVDPSPISSPVTAYAELVNMPQLRPSKKRVALNKTHKSTRDERTVSSARVKKAINRDRQGGSPSELQVERAFTGEKGAGKKGK